MVTSEKENDKVIDQKRDVRQELARGRLIIELDAQETSVGLLPTELLSILRHSLGLDNPGAKGRSYRNHYVAGGIDVDRCRQLVARGLMREHIANELTGGAPCFSVTEKGKIIVEKTV